MIARAQWLRQAHAALDRAMFAAYGWDLILTDDKAEIAPEKGRRNRSRVE
jgi:hypothetical protein